MIKDGERIAGVEGVLADAATELDDVAAGLRVGEANRRQFHEVAKHGEEVAGVDSVAARLWRRLFFHLDDLLRGARCADFLIPVDGDARTLRGETRCLVESRCRCPH